MENEQIRHTLNSISEEDARIVQRVLDNVFARAVHVELVKSKDGDYVTIDAGMHLQKEMINTEIKTLTGKRKFSFQGYSLSVQLGEDEQDLGQERTLPQIIEIIVKFVASDRARLMMDAIGSEQYAAELEYEKTPEFQDAVKEVLKK
jgi:hydrogenase maturation factor